MKIALAPIALRSYFTRPTELTFKNDIKSMLTRVRQIGYEAIEMGTPQGFSPEEFKALVDEVGIKILSIGRVDYQSLLAGNVDAKIKEGKILGGTNLMIGSMDPLVLGNQNELNKFIRGLNKSGKALKEAGIHLSYHNHAVDFSKINGKTIFEQLVEGTDPNYVFFEPDTHWLQAGGAHVITWLKRLKGRMHVVHFKDYAIDQYSDHTFLECTHKLFAEIGEGNLNWPGIIKECLDQNIEWCSVEQDVCQRPPFESLAISYKNLKAFGV